MLNFFRGVFHGKNIRRGGRGAGGKAPYNMGGMGTYLRKNCDF
jgi:hypothetical protein